MRKTQKMLLVETKALTNMNKEFWQGFIGAIIIIGVAFMVLKVGMDRQAKVDCYTWQKWQREYQGFQPSQEMMNQCIGLRVPLNK